MHILLQRLDVEKSNLLFMLPGCPCIRNKQKLFLLKKRYMLGISCMQKICYSMEEKMHEQDYEVFNRLPTEVILENLLPNLDLPELCTLRSVSKAWNYRICLYFSRTKKLDLSEFKDAINETGFSSIVQHLSKLQEIILDGCWRTASKSNLLTLFRNCQSLRYFSSKRCKFVDDEVLSCMSQNCRMLETINISCCYQARI